VSVRQSASGCKGAGPEGSGQRRERPRDCVPSEEVKKRVEDPNAQRHSTARIEVHVDTNPIRPAERRYVQENGSEAYDQLLARLFDELFPAE
jgi:hypothetical protein